MQKQNGVDLSLPRRGAHAVYWYNLHIVLVNDRRWRVIKQSDLEKIGSSIESINSRRDHLISRVAILPDHIHLIVGCNLTESPLDAALTYMNEICLNLGNAPLFQFSLYVGTCGEYDLGVFWQGQ
ncbi:MAG TPA: transposase [Acidobacteriota bacterium]|nr:transposase [Acidobacteriota bacterium]